MKENRKLLREVLNDIRHDMTDEKDRRRAENDYKVNLKTEIMIEDLYDKVNSILAKQSALEQQFRGDRKKEPETAE